jgi:uncharacterized protein YktB (UPF0637 family)
MKRCDEIVANVKMEECYAGMSLVYINNPGVREEIENTIEKVKSITGLNPEYFDSSKEHTEEKQAIYIEFSDEVQRESGAFFELVLKELHIDKCANDVIDHKE